MIWIAILLLVVVRLLVRFSTRQPPLPADLPEVGRVAGLEAQALVLEPRDDLRYGYTLWAEVQSGLLLIALIIMAVNLIVDVLYAVIDPRVRLS